MVRNQAKRDTMERPQPDTWRLGVQGLGAGVVAPFGWDPLARLTLDMAKRKSRTQRTMRAAGRFFNILIVFFEVVRVFNYS
jgi:hypothetical protein